MRTTLDSIFTVSSCLTFLAAGSALLFLCSLMTNPWQPTVLKANKVII